MILCIFNNIKRSDKECITRSKYFVSGSLRQPKKYFALIKYNESNLFLRTFIPVFFFEYLIAFTL